MGLLPEKEPKKSLYENPTDVSALNIERKEVVTPIPTQFKGQVVDDNGNPVISTPQSVKADIVIPSVSKEVLETTAKHGDTEDSLVWSAEYWLRLFKKAIHFGWKVLFNTNELVKK